MRVRCNGFGRGAWWALAAVVALGAVRAGAAPPVVDRLRLRAGDVELDADAPRSTDAVVVQMTGPLTRAQRARLADAGVDLLGYLPRHAFLARVDGADMAALARMPEVARIGAYSAEWRVCPQARALCTAVGRRAPRDANLLQAYRARIGERRAALLDAGLVQLAVTALPGESARDVAAGLEGVPNSHVVSRTVVNGRAFFDVTAPADTLVQLSNVAGVQFIEDAPAVVERNTSTAPLVQSGEALTTPFWNLGLRGEGQIIGIIDSPPRLDHCMFADTVAPGPGHRKFAYVYPDPLTSPAVHGTMVAGFVAGDAGVVGACEPGDGLACAARLAVTNLNQISASSTAVFDRLAAAHDAGAAIHTNSWGDDGTTAYTSWCYQVDAFSHAYEQDAVIFAATNLSTLRTPENAKNVLAVGATYPYPNHNSRCYGGVGPTADGRRKPEVFAPGCQVTSASSGGVCSTSSGSGTSFAAPTVAAAMGLVRQYFVEGLYPDGEWGTGPSMVPSGALMRAMLLNGAGDMSGVSGYPSNAEGWGLIDLHRVLRLAGDARRLLVYDVLNSNGLSTGEGFRVDVGVWSADDPLHVTLVFTDPPGEVGSADPVVNDLDLRVTAPGGTAYLGNVFANGRSAGGGSADARNTVEQVLLVQPQVGEYAIEIVATEVNGLLPQGFALVITGRIMEISNGAEAGFGDADADGDCDLHDFAAFQRCFGGAGASYGDPACAVFDIDADGDIDAADHAAVHFVRTAPQD